jgi:hypothetical protein
LAGAILLQLGSAEKGQRRVTTDPGLSTGSTTPSPEAENGPQEPAPLRFAVGSVVQLAGRPRYLKTADPMPMLRPPDLVDGAETGVVIEVRARRTYAVRFRRGAFLLTEDQLMAAADG